MSTTSAPAVTRVRIATRGSALAIRQTELVVNALRLHWPGLEVELTTVRTIVDQDQAQPIAARGNGVFVRGVEAELLAGRADIAVHSAKDVPATEQPGLVLAAFPPRADARDALVSRARGGWARLPRGARLGTGSARRAALARALRPDLDVALIRGNVDTRLRRLHEGEYDAIVLAAAGLERLGLWRAISEPLDPAIWLPAPGQGALAVQCRADPRLHRLLAPLDHAPTRTAVTAERAALRRLGGGCSIPFGAYARLTEGELVINGALLSSDGDETAMAERRGDPRDAILLGMALAEQLLRHVRLFWRRSARRGICARRV